jgi:hypothetical protein
MCSKNSVFELVYYDVECPPKFRPAERLDSPSRNIGGLELKKLKFSEDQIVKILAEAAKGDKTVAFF